MKLFIKNMVSNRCKMIVTSVLENLGLHAVYVQLGEAEIRENITEQQFKELKAELLRYELDLLEDNKSILVEKIKNTIVEMVHYSDEPPRVKFSVFLSEKLNYNYTYLSNLFSKVKGITIERYIILHKIERVKEMLVYTESPLSEISRKLHFCSVQHLTTQFKQITGLNPTNFKKAKQMKLIALDNL
jgi:AraC-like DNA-binding protein